MTPTDLSASGPKPVPTKFLSWLFPAGPRPTHSVKADAMRDPVTGRRWVDVSWARWSDLSHQVRHTFRSAEVVELASLGPNRCGWAALRDAMLAELGDDPFADLLLEADRAAG